MFRKIQHIHFVGIGGEGMSGIAEVLLTLSYHVTGSDLHESESVRRIRALGGTVFIGHAASHIGNAQVVVVSSAVPPTNPEVVAAKAKVIPVIPRAEMLAELMRLKYGVAIAGAHGKTTTTSLVANVLAEGGLDPTIVIGGKVNALGSHARLGRGDLLVAEADESDGSFMKLSPTVVVVTNVDREHLDHYGTMERLCETFLDFINKVPFYGLSVLCADDPYLAALLPRVTKRYLMYGLTPSADLVGADVQLHVGVAAFSARLHGEPLGRFKVAMPGIHNVRNALAAIAVGLELGVTLPHIGQALGMTMATIRLRSKRRSPRRRTDGAGGWWCCSSRTGSRGRRICSRSSRRRSSRRTTCSSPTSIQPGRRRSRASPANGWRR